MSILTKLFSFLETRFVPPRFSWWRTCYLNFRVLPYSQAIKFPIFIYGNVKMPLLAGVIEFRDCQLRKGMVRIGKQDPFASDSGQGLISIAPAGKIVFHGPANISTNTVLRVFGNGCLEIGKFIFLGSGVKVICNGGSIQIGNYSRISFNTHIINSGFHSVVDLTANKVSNHIRPIIIGDCCWIGNSSSITGGTVLKPRTIVGSGSFVSKDFSKLKEENQLIGGRPAKLIKAGVARVFNPHTENEIMSYFKNNPNETVYTLDRFDDTDMTVLETEEFD